MAGATTEDLREILRTKEIFGGEVVEFRRLPRGPKR